MENFLYLCIKQEGTYTPRVFALRERPYTFFEANTNLKNIRKMKTIKRKMKTIKQTETKRHGYVVFVSLSLDANNALHINGTLEYLSGVNVDNFFADSNTSCKYLSGVNVNNFFADSDTSCKYDVAPSNTGRALVESAIKAMRKYAEPLNIVGYKYFYELIK